MFLRNYLEIFDYYMLEGDPKGEFSLGFFVD